MPVDPAAVARLLSWDGIGIAIDARLERFVDASRADAPYRAESAGEHLVDTIDYSHGESSESALTARAGCNPDGGLRGYAYIVHEGSRPHGISPNPPRKSLKFLMAGKVVYARHVNHPGTTADPFLTRNIGELIV